MSPLVYTLPNPTLLVNATSHETPVPLEYAVDAIARTQSEEFTVLYHLTAFNGISLVSDDAYPSCTRIMNDLVESTLLRFSGGS
jgi:hypothetical protein